MLEEAARFGWTIEEANPYHEPAGSAKGGEFAKGPGAAKTLAEAEDWVRDNLGIECKYRGISVDDANAMNEGLADEMKGGGARLVTGIEVNHRPKALLMAAGYDGKVYYSPTGLKKYHPPMETWEKRRAAWEDGRINAEKRLKEETANPHTDAYIHKSRMESLQEYLSRYGTNVAEIDRHIAQGDAVVPFGAPGLGRNRRESIKMCMVHEIGHQRHFKLSADNNAAIHNHFIDKKSVFPTEYSRKNRLEWFAESYSLWRTGHGKVIDPWLRDFMEKYL